MNYIRHLAGFFDRVAKDDRLGPLHVSMYVSLFQFWNASRFKNPISISRSELMRVSKISAKATYHKCIKELNNYGYLRYEPSFNPIRGSLVYLFNFETGVEPLEERSHTKIKPSSSQVEEPYINNTNIINSKLAKEQAHEISIDEFEKYSDNSSGEFHVTKSKKIVTHENTSSNFDGANPQEKKKNCAKRKREDPVPLPESFEEVKAFFADQKSTAIEAEKFYNYFQSNGWKVGGRAPMKDWQAAARNWLLNSHKFETKKPSLHASTVKDYGEPL